MKESMLKEAQALVRQRNELNDRIGELRRALPKPISDSPFCAPRVRPGLRVTIEIEEGCCGISVDISAAQAELILDNAIAQAGRDIEAVNDQLRAMGVSVAGEKECRDLS
jgi:hypothetical protein